MWLLRAYSVEKLHLFGGITPDSLHLWQVECATMMGLRQDAQSALFYEFSMESHVPADHMLRSVDQFVDLSDIRKHLAPFYSSTSRPSVDPNAASRWFCRLDLTGQVPDHSTFSKNRHGRFRDSDLLRHLFKTVVARCIAEGLVSCQRFAADASIIQADANRQNSSPQAKWTPEGIDAAQASRAIREYLATLDEEAFGGAAQFSPNLRRIPIQLRNGQVRAVAGLLCLFNQLSDRY